LFGKEVVSTAANPEADQLKASNIAFLTAVILIGLTAITTVLGAIWVLLRGGNPQSLIPVAAAAVAG